MAAAAAVTSAVVAGEGMFTARVMTGVAYMASPIARFVSVEMIELLFTAAGERPMVTVVRIVAVVDVAKKAAMPMKPGSGSDEQSAYKPVRPVVTIGRTVIGSVVEVPIRAHWRRSNTHSNLRCGQGCTAENNRRDS